MSVENIPLGKAWCQGVEQMEERAYNRGLPAKNAPNSNTVTQEYEMTIDKWGDTVFKVTQGGPDIAAEVLQNWMVIRFFAECRNVEGA